MVEVINLVDSDDEWDVHNMPDVPDMPDARAAYECHTALKAIFPDMCPTFMRDVALLNDFNSDRAVDHVLNLPTYSKVVHGNKRKRSPVPQEQVPQPRADEMSLLKDQFNNPARRLEPKSRLYRNFAYVHPLCLLLPPNFTDTTLRLRLLSQEFPRARVDDIRKMSRENGDVLFATFEVLQKLQDDWDNGRPTNISAKKTRTAVVITYTKDKLAQAIHAERDPIRKETLEELAAARLVRDTARLALEVEMEKKRAEDARFALAKATGNITDCACCCSEFIHEELVYCNGENPHVSLTFPLNPSSN